MRYKKCDGIDNHLFVRTSIVRITFDPAKRDATLAERGLDFADASKVFNGSSETEEDVRFTYPKSRFVTKG